MKAVITPAQPGGTIRAIASKSQAHRMLICAALADAPTEIVCRELSRDIEATADCLRAMGSRIVYARERGCFSVTPLNRNVPDQRITIDVGESGSTLRFLLPVVCALGFRTHIVMHGRLPERPLSPLWEELEAHGAALRRNSDGSVDTDGRLGGTAWKIAADVSSQFISGLLFSLPLLADRPKADPARGGNAAADRIFSLTLTGNVESRNYILMTLDALKAFGVEYCRDDTGSMLSLAQGSAYRSPGRTDVEGDWSNGAFWICAAAMSEKELKVSGLDPESSQGDRAVLSLRDLILSSRENGEPVTIDARDVPDLVPVLSVLAASVSGTTAFTHAERLRIKESDRIRTTVEMLTDLGAKAKETADGLIVYGTGRLAGGCIDSCNDHRIAMSAAVASIICTGTVTVEQAQAVQKSYPDFWKDFAGLGGQVRLE